MVKVYTCVYRIYVNAEEPHCPLPKEFVPFCEEGQELNCRHYKMIMEKLKKENNQATEDQIRELYMRIMEDYVSLNWQGYFPKLLKRRY